MKYICIELDNLPPVCCSGKKELEKKRKVGRIRQEDWSSKELYT